MTVKKMAAISRYIGLSGDVKPTGVPVGSTFFEYNTKDRYVTYDGTLWSVIEPGATPAGGTYFWVDGTAGVGVDTNSGTSSASPLLTITAALGKCTANAGDIILVMANSPSTPPPSETFPISVDKAGVTIRGTRGSGILSDSGIGADVINTACLSIAAPYVTIEDMYLGIDGDGSDGGIVEFDGTNNYFGVTFRRCTFDTQFVSVYGIYLPHDQPYLLVEDCIFGRTDIASYTTAGISIGNCTCGMIRRNVFNGVTGVGILVGAGCGNLTVLDNRFLMNSDNAGDAITTIAGCTGNVFDGNRAYFGSNADPVANPFTEGGTADQNHWGLNYKGISATMPA